MKPRPLCSLCKTRPAELRGYSKHGEPSYRSRCPTCRAAARIAHGLPARRGREGKPGVPRCPACNHPWKACPMCGVVLDPGAAGDGKAQDRSLLVLREIGNRRGRVSYEEFLAIAARLRYDRRGAQRLLGDHPRRGSCLRRVKGDVELTRDGYELLAGIGLRPPYRLLGQPRSGEGNTRRK